MLDILLSRLKEEIAIDGTSGSSIETVWEYVEIISKEIAQGSGTSIVPLVDDRYKAFIWNYLKSEKDLDFYENIAPAEGEPAQIQAAQEEGEAEVVNAITYDVGNNNMEIEQEEAGPSNTEPVENPDVTIANDADLMDLIQPNKDEEVFAQKRKQPPSSKKRSAPPKKKAKAKPKPKPKKKKAPKKKHIAGDSDDDFEGGDSSSESESEFEDDQSESEEEDDESAISEDESDEEYGSDQEAMKKGRKKATNAIVRAPKKENWKPKENRAKANLHPIENIAESSYEQVAERYGNRLYITAAAELQEKQLYANVPPGQALSSNLAVILQEIIRARSKGLYQAYITKILDIDSRSTGHYCKSLEEKGVIVRNGISVNGMRTNICVHVKYATKKDQVMNMEDEDVDDVPYNVDSKGRAYSQVAIRNALFELIKDAPDNTILSEDVLRALGFDYSKLGVRKWFNRTINELCVKGYLKKTNLTAGGRPRRCLHLVKLPDESVPIEAIPMDLMKYPIRIKSMKRDVPILHLLVDSTPESQCSSVLLAAGENGVTQREIAFAMNMDEPRIMQKLLERCCEMTGVGLEHFGAMRVLEFEGKQRRYRYYTYSAYHKVHENMDVDLTPLPEQELDESDFQERDLFADVPHTKKEYSLYLNQSKELSRNILTVTALKKGATLGRPRKYPPGPPRNRQPRIEGQPVKKGRPRKPVDPNAPPPAKKRKYTKRAKPVPAAEGSSTANGNTETTTASVAPPVTEGSSNANPVLLDNSESATTGINAPLPKGSSTAHPLLIDDTEPVHTTPTAPHAATGEQLIVSPITEVTVAQEAPTAPETPVASVEKKVSEGVSTTVIEETITTTAEEAAEPSTDKANETAAPADAMVVDTTIPPVPKQSVPPLPLKFTPEASSSKSKEKANKTAAPPPPPVAHNLRKRTIFDYFGKASKNKVDKTPREPEKEASPAVDTQPSEEVANVTAEAIDVTTEALSTNVPTTTEPIPIEIDDDAAPEKGATAPTSEAIPPAAEIIDVEKEVVACEKEAAAVREEETIASTSEVDRSADSNIEVQKEQNPWEREATALDMDDAEEVVAHIVEDAMVEKDASAPSAEEPSAATEEPSAAAEAQGDSTPTAAEANSEDRQVAIIPETTAQTPTSTAKETPPSGPLSHYKPGGKHKNQLKQVNVYMEVRMKVLLILLEENPMVDFGKDLMNLYLKKATEMSGPPKYNVCNRTLWRSAQTLSERGLAKIDVIDCPLLNGKSVQRKILVRNDVDMEGEDYKHFIAYLKDRRAIQVNYSTYKKPEEVDMKVERLEERIPRMQEQLRQLEEAGNLKEAKLLHRRIEELSGNAARYRPRDGKRLKSSWLITAVQFGWVHARMLRCKLLYTFLFGLLDREETLPGVDKEKRDISTITIINEMPLKLVLQIIGVYNPVERVIQYIRDPNHQHLKYKEIPEKVSNEIYSDRNKFRLRLRHILYGLEYLDLVKANYIQFPGNQSPGRYSNLGSSYHIFPEVAIREVYKLGQPVLRVHNLDTAADIALYWSELQYVSTKVDDDLPEEEREPEPSDPFEVEFWGGLRNARNWSTTTIYTRAQRKALNSYVNKVTGETPVNNTNKIVDIAEQLDLTVYSVKGYFTKVEAAIARKNKNTELRKIERRLFPTQRRAPPSRRMVVEHGRRTINLSSTRAFRAPARKLWNFSQPQITAESAALVDQHNQSVANQRANGENLYLDDVDEVPVLTNKTQNLRLARSKRTTWTEEENELFIYAYAILCLRAKKTRFLWSAVHNKVFPNKPASRFRQHLQHILMNPMYVEQVDSATKSWTQFYQEGIERGDIQDPDVRDIVNFDILGHLAYFLDRLSKKDTRISDAYLPKTLDDLNSNFEVVRGVAEAQPYFIEDKYYELHTLASKMNILHHQSFSARRLDDNVFDIPDESAVMKEGRVEERQRRLLKAYGLMCLLTPSERYDPLYSYAVFNSFPKVLQEEVVKEMRSEGTLIICKGDRPIPGTRLGLSSKFTSFMAGKLPKNFFEQAREYDKYLNQLGKNRFMADMVSSGMMGCILSLVSSNKLNVTMANKNALMEKCETMIFASRRTDRSLTVFELDIEKTETEDFNCTSLVPLEPLTNVQSYNHFDIELTNFLSLQEWYMKPLCREIIEVLQEQKEAGLLLYYIKHKLKCEADDKAIYHAIHLLSTHTPALICLVGFDAPRYVLAMYTSAWTIHTKEIMNQFSAKFQKKIACAQEQSNSESAAVNRKDIIVTNLWTDTNGEVTELVLNEVKQALTDYVLRRPGVPEASIYRHFSAAINRKDVRDLLDILVEQGVFRKVSLFQPVQLSARKNIFSKSHSLKCTTKQIIERSTQTCYWVTEDMYRNIN